MHVDINYVDCMRCDQNQMHRVKCLKLYSSIEELERLHGNKFIEKAIVCATTFESDRL
jgi:hypothetical protein